MLSLALKEQSGEGALVELQRDIAAIGDRRLEIERQIVRQYALATPEVQKQLAAATRMQEITQKAKAINDAAPARRMALEKRDLDEMLANRNITRTVHRRKTQEAEEEYKKAYGVRIGPRRSSRPSTRRVR